ncbi:MAG: sigma-70 family RNA polymerase sigma factor [Bacteroidetes bacterium]|nr:sigma-70 family RNA polymerase sigma factor [Bacteroidota bacterium]MBL7102750.1 sigma-70 family RNA polymerase sigma factor [Bacteroidales bacterium]
MCRNPESGNYGFNLLVRKYQKQVYWHIRRMVIEHNDTDDLVQDTFIKVWKNLKNFRSDSKLYTWIYRIATNEALTFLKSKKRKFFIPIVDYENHLSQSIEDDNYFSGDEIQMKLQKAILTLPEKQRLVFNMKYFNEMKYDDMSEVLGTSVGALKASFHIAAKKIESFVKEN